VLTGEIAAVPAEGAILPETHVSPRLTRQKMLNDARRISTLDEAKARAVNDVLKTKEEAVTPPPS
jgi:hypothetical protein